MSRIVKILITALLLIPVSGLPVRAAEVNLVPSDQVVAVGENFSVNIAISLDEGEALAGGVINLSYDDSNVEILEVAIHPYWDFKPDPGEKDEDGLWKGIGFDSFENDPATGNAVIATIFLEALAVGTSQLAVLDSSEFFSDKEEFYPTVTAASIQVNTPPVEDPPVVEKGDINNDSNVDLSDAILALQVLSRIDPASTVYRQADVNGDDSVGIEEVIYILQIVSELRQ